jgi:hypothetical protein
MWKIARRLNADPTAKTRTILSISVCYVGSRVLFNFRTIVPGGGGELSGA